MAEKKAEFNLKQLAVSYRYFWPGGLAVLGCVGLLVVAVGSVNAALSTRADVAKRERVLTDVSTKVGRLELLAQGELDQVAETVEKTLPSEKPVFQVLETLRAISEDSEVVISDLASNPGSLATGSARVRETSARRGEPTFEQLEVTLEIVGTFEGLRQFLDDLVASAPLVDVGALRISSRGQEGSDEFNGEVDLVVYWMPELTEDQIGSEVGEMSEEEREVYEQLRVISNTGSSEFEQ